MKNTINSFGRILMFLMSISLSGIYYGCDYGIELPEAGSKKDTTLPTADFSYASTSGDFRTIKFTDLSSEGTIYLWEFEDGAISTEQDPTFTYEDGEGTYSVTLTVSDANGESDTITKEVVVVEGPYQPVILEAGFEDNTLPGGSGDGRDSWRVSWATIFGISGSPVTYGSQAAKLEASSARAGYQEIIVEAETNYDLRFWYTMNNNSSDPWAIVSAVGVTQAGGPGSITSKQLALDNTLASITVNNTEDPAVYVQDKLTFNSGSNTVIGIYFYNDANVEARFDNFTIDIGAEGAVPPSAGFSSTQSEVNYLEYSFSNSSTNATSYSWDFGDGSTSTEEEPTHVYANPGMYTVTLTATNDLNKTASLSKTINIQAPVTADFSYIADAGDYKKIFFTDESIGAVSLMWDFGDGYSSSLEDPMHLYEQDGIYTVTLTATSITGNSDVVTMDITVSAGFIASITDPDFTSTSFWRNTNLEASADLLFGDGTWVVNSSSTHHSWVGGNTSGMKLPTYESESSGTDDMFNRRRWIYQAIQVEPNTNYTISWYMRNKDSGTGATVTGQIRNAPFDDALLIDTPGSTLITEQIYNAASGHDNTSFTLTSISFNSGSSSEVVLFIFNDYTLDDPGATGNLESESYLDLFSISEN